MRARRFIVCLLISALGLSCATAPGPVPLRPIGQAIELHEEHFRNCYARAFKSVSPAVEMTVKFDIYSGGKVRNAKVVRNSVPNPVFQRCVLGILGAIQFPSPDQGHHYEVNYPFRFKGRD